MYTTLVKDDNLLLTTLISSNSLIDTCYNYCVILKGGIERVSCIYLVINITLVKGDSLFLTILVVCSRFCFNKIQLLCNFEVI